MTGRERLLLAAELLWGKNWKTAMGAEMGVHRRTLSRYNNGKAVPLSLLQELDGALILRIGAMTAALGGVSALLLPSVRWGPDALVVFSSGEEMKLESDLCHRLLDLLQEVKIQCDALKGPADAAE